MLDNDNEKNENPSSEGQLEKSDGENQNIKKVRDILFGRNINEYEKRFRQLESALNAELNLSKQQGKALYDNLEDYIKAEFDGIHEAINKKEVQYNDELKTLSEALKMTRNDLSDFEQKTNQQFRSQYDTLQSKNTELLEQIQKEGRLRIEGSQVIETQISEIKMILVNQQEAFKEMKTSLFQQLYDQGKVVTQKIDNEQKSRELTDTELKIALENVSSRLLDFRNDSDKCFSDLNNTTKEHHSVIYTELPENINNLGRRTNEQSNSLKRELDDIFTKYNSFSSKTTDDFKDLRELLHGQIKNLRFELEQQNLRLSQQLRNEQELQRQQKVNKNTLALMFSELALKLGEDKDEE